MSNRPSDGAERVATPASGRTAVWQRIGGWLAWGVPFAIGLAATLVFAAGFREALLGAGSGAGTAADVDTVAPASPLPAAGSGRVLRLVALGDSLTRGTGDRPGGGGYPAMVAAELRRRGASVTLGNLAVDGLESGGLLDQLALPEAQALVADADWIAVSIGGNDLSHALRREGSVTAISVATALRTYATNATAILATLRKHNAAAPIALLGIYSPLAAVPEEERAGGRLLLEWNAVLERAALASPGTRVVPTFDLFFGHPQRLAADRLHPNHGGYELIAARWLQSVPMEGRAAALPSPTE